MPMMVGKALRPALPREEKTEITTRLAFFQRIAAMVRRRLADDPGPTPGRGGSGDIDAAVGQLIGDAVDAGEVTESATQAGGRK
jgi:type I restriction enzyme R subunit